MGYTVIESTYREVQASTRYFVPLDQSLEIWQVTLTNQRSEAVDLSLFASVEFCLWDAFDDSTNFQRNYNIAEVEVEQDVIYHKTEYRERRDHFSYFASSVKTDSFDTQRDAFLGVLPWLGLSSGVEKKEPVPIQSLMVGLLSRRPSYSSDPSTG